MAIRIKSSDAIATKFAARAGASGKDYADGVQNPRRPWASSTAAAKDSYAAGVQGAIQAGSFEKGVQKAGDEKYTRKASTIGANRFPQGAQAAKGDYQSGVDPYLQVISNLTLPPRGPKGDPSNNNRVSAVTQALRAKKLGS